MSKTQPARGTRDFLPSDVRKRNHVIKIIKDVYEKYGFEPLETPSIENLETLTGKYGEEGGQLMFKILKRGEKLSEELEKGTIKSEKDLSDLALRYDLTVPLARVVANYKNELPKFFKRYQIQPVWRADRPAKGRYREFYQCDVDAIGSKSMLVEAELISAVYEILERLGFDDFEVKLNHRKMLKALLEGNGIPRENHIDVITAIDKLEKIGTDGVADELSSKGLSEDLINKFIDVIKRLQKMSMSIDKEITEVRNELVPIDLVITEDDEITPNTYNHQLLSNLIYLNDEIDNDDIEQATTDFRRILTLTNSKSSKIKLDVSLARGLSYYTGAIFEIVLTNGDFAGSIGGGGRYDGLIGMFGKEQIPACGFSLGLERILYVMEERGMFPPELQNSSPADVMVTIWDKNSASESLKLARELREKDLRVLVYPEADKLGKQFKYADSLGIKYVCVVGESELAANKVTVKNLSDGTQQTVDRAELAQILNAI